MPEGPAKFLGIGISPGALIAAFCGGMVLVVLMRGLNWRRVLTVFVSGIFLTMFLAPIVIDLAVPYALYIGIKENNIVNAIGAFFGITGMMISNGIISVVSALLKWDVLNEPVATVVADEEDEP